MPSSEHRVRFETEECTRRDASRLALSRLPAREQTTQRGVAQAARSRRRSLLHALELHAQRSERAHSRPLPSHSMQALGRLAGRSLPQRQAVLHSLDHARLLAQLAARCHAKLHDRKPLQGIKILTFKIGTFVFLI